MSEEAVVEAEGLIKTYGSARALDEVDLRVDAGVIHGLLGPNGAGKTTLLSSMFGLTLPDAGTLKLFGRTQAEAGSAWLDGVGGFVEAPRFYPYLSGRRNLEILAGLDGGTAAELVGQLIDLVGLGGASAAKVKSYSLGMRQRLGLASALLRRPRLLILDEPTNGVDPAGIRDLQDALRQLAASGFTVILSSHDVARIDELCDSVTVLARGRVVFSGGLDALRSRAPAARWRLDTSDDETALAMASASVHLEARAEPKGLIVTADQEPLDRYVIDLGRAGIAVRGLTMLASPLESTFLTLTGGAEQGGGER